MGLRWPGPYPPLVASIPLQQSPGSKEDASARLRVALVVSHVPLRRVVEELLVARPGLRIVGRFSEIPGLVRELGRLCPDIVVASIRTLGRERASIPNAIRRVSPGSRLILIHPIPVFPCEARGNRIHLPEEGLVRLLGPAVRQLAGGAEEPLLNQTVLGDPPCIENHSAPHSSSPCSSSRLLARMPT
jgi:hypothetical protein